MSCTHNVLGSTVRLGTPAMKHSRTCSLSPSSFVHASALCTPTRTRQHHKFPRLICSSPKNKIRAPICLFGEKRNSSGENKGFSWDLLKDAVEGLRPKNKVQDILRDQMRQREFGDGDGDGDGNPPRRGGGGGSDDTEDEGFAGKLDETMQVFLATTSFILVYIYIIRGAELFKLARDYIKYLLGGEPSMRLQRVMNKWRKTLNQFSYDAEDCDDWLERLIVTTPTWWHRPEEIARVAKSKRRSDHQQN